MDGVSYEGPVVSKFCYAHLASQKTGHWVGNTPDLASGASETRTIVPD